MITNAVFARLFVQALKYQIAVCLIFKLEDDDQCKTTDTLSKRQEETKKNIPTLVDIKL